MGIGQRINAREAGMRFDLRGNRSPEQRAGCVEEGGRGGAAIQRRQRGEPSNEENTQPDQEKTNYDAREHLHGPDICSALVRRGRPLPVGLRARFHAGCWERGDAHPPD